MALTRNTEWYYGYTYHQFTQLYEISGSIYLQWFSKQEYQNVGMLILLLKKIAKERRKIFMVS